MTVGSIRTTVNPPSGIYEALLEKAERERSHYKTTLEEISISIEDWIGSMVKEPPEDFIMAIQARINSRLKQ